MESWSCVEEEKGYLFSDEMDFSLDAFMRSRKALVEWDNKGPCNFEGDGFASDREIVWEFVAKEGQQSMEFVDLGFPDLFRKSFNSGQAHEISTCDLDSNSSKRGNSSTHVIALVSSLGEEVSESKHLRSLVESKTHGSSLIDLKLGSLADYRGASNDEIAEEGFTLSSMHPTMLTKRARTSSSPIQAPVCQVYGCNVDLSSSKEYHKRHKVCDVHSKTAKVIVNGIEQRFCQQCSRFHLLAEFDDGKRSCRRRLEGHNERRRKQQFDYMSSKQHKIHQSFQGTDYLGSSLQKRSQFPFQDIFRSGIILSGKYDQISHSGHVKLEHESIYSSQEALALKHGQELSGCALSLLSAQSQNPPRHSTGNLSPSSLIFQSTCLQNRDDQVSETPSGINSVDKYVPTESFRCGMNSKEDITSGSSILSNDYCQPSASCNVKYRPSYEHGTTVDLFQLSSNLQRVEQQRNGLIKWENDDFCFPTV
ncbi:hypothetical protein TanjilG_06877 [Lupinus angustifolius]|uniref:SBP-type domain-containing protein n=1 Tax=Lupinus angustifolius TaxID=3871 RepID=A0A4P1RRY6_LUPAN|nr:PREDICTED: squamosa promoter-binding-like protein 6 [Lupinus angustifolius]XP_019428525.1 PREDICTED: squamosa promoter-binding-like protein 6 [Lupinus angustifolius]XP_019428533.1 PREDICTED: squamosa promoter-binding-like protein 6 [Lupinus angustifolius]OIW16837.1 hypothetical protein TanjilG_06877 [Lupinus angustifolius]